MSTECVGAGATRAIAAFGAAAALCTASGATTLDAQERLVGARVLTAAPTYEQWTFGSGLYQFTPASDDSVRLRRASQWSIPMSVSVPIGERWAVDVAGAYASGEVVLAEQDTALGTDRYTLSGPTDVRVRATGRVVGDNVVVTLGFNAGSGQTSLDPGQLAALRVLAAPALAMQRPAFGAGTGATAGVVLARQMVGWAWAFGAAYEVRGKYSPIASIAAGAPNPDFNPGDALHLSVGADGLIGEHGMTVGVSTNFFGRDKLRSAGTTGLEAGDVRLGPFVTADWRLRVATRRVRDLTLYVVERHRFTYEQDGVTVEGSSGNYLDGGARGVLPAGRVGVLVALDARHHTGLSVDKTLATAATRAAGLTVGVVREFGRYSLQPFVRGQVGTLDTGGRRASARGLSAGITFGTRL